MKRVLLREDTQRDPNLIWNEFVRLLAESDADQLDSSQRPAHLTFWYDSEVQNGGHLQFFANRPTELVPETVGALRRLGAAEQAVVLTKAFDRWNDRPREMPNTVDEYVELAVRAEFEELDAGYYRASPSVTELLEQHLELNCGEFFELAG